MARKPDGAEPFNRRWMHFYFTSPQYIPAISQTGLDRESGRHRLAKPDKLIERDGKEVLVIQDGHRLPEYRDLQNGWIEVGSVPKSAFSNLNPYRPVRELAAGGGVLVRRTPQRDEVLLIRRKGLWDLPKGKQDKGEAILECACREVREELGIDEASAHVPLGETLHGYSENGDYVVKRTTWFLMSSRAESFRPQLEEGIDNVCWVPVEAAAGIVAYSSLQPVLRRASRRLEEAGRIREDLAGHMGGGEATPRQSRAG
jgi:8-oxo-dGTP pyrophosphatase MutT (NUDIX family)